MKWSDATIEEARFTPLKNNMNFILDHVVKKVISELFQFTKKKGHDEKGEKLEDTEYEMKTDSFYYGKIPTKRMTRGKLVIIMAKAFTKMKMDASKEVGTNVVLTKGDIGNIMDRWFEHDSRSEMMFDGLISQDDFDSFVNQVYDKFKKLH